MTNEIVIESGIPLPAKKSCSRYTAALMSMEVGQSFFLAGKTQSFFGNMFRVAKPKKFATRQVDGGVRIWRIE